MKLVVKNSKSSTIDSKELNDSHLIGCKTKKGARGNIVKIFDGGYISHFLEQNDKYESITIFESIDDIMNFHFKHGTDCYVFETEAELHSWLGEQYI